MKIENPHVVQAMLFEIEQELANVEFLSRTHGKRRTHNAGCHGHLCTAGERNFSALRARDRALSLGKALPEYEWDPPPELSGGVFSWDKRLAVLEWMGIDVSGMEEPEVIPETWFVDWHNSTSLSEVS